MLTIRKEQIKVFDEMAMKQFIESMVIHVKKHFPEESKPMDDEQLKNYIRDVISSGKKYGLVSERDICKYLNLTMHFGKDFDKNPENEWMKTMLMDGIEPNPSIRISKLYNEALKRSAAK
jgi:hypothetical protein